LEKCGDLVEESNTYFISNKETLSSAKSPEERRKSIVVFSQDSDNFPYERFSRHLKKKKPFLNKAKHGMVAFIKFKNVDCPSGTPSALIRLLAVKVVLDELKSGFAPNTKFASAGRGLKQFDDEAKELARNPHFRKQAIEALKTLRFVVKKRFVF
jgi:hypothetical protein